MPSASGHSEFIRLAALGFAELRPDPFFAAPGEDDEEEGDDAEDEEDEDDEEDDED